MTFTNPEVFFARYHALMAQAQLNTIDDVQQKRQVAAQLFPDASIDLALAQMEYFHDNLRPLVLTPPLDIASKLHWLKLNYRHPDLGRYVDKIACREIVASRAGDNLLPKLYWTGTSVDELANQRLATPFALKANHGWNMNRFYRDPAAFDAEQVRDVTAQWLATNHYLRHGEWAYSQVTPRLLAEELLCPEHGPLYDFKFFCFNSVPKFLKVDAGRASVRQQVYVDLDWRLMPCYNPNYQLFSDLPPRPPHFSRLVELAYTLAEGLPFVRLDLYDTGERVVFGEFTLYPCGGNLRLEPEIWNRWMGDLLELPALIMPATNQANLEIS